MSFLSKVTDSAKKGLYTALIAGTVYLGGLGYKPESHNPIPKNHLIQYRTDAVNVAKGYSPNEWDLAVDYAIINRDTLNTDNDAWRTLINPKFAEYIELPWDGHSNWFYDWVNNGTQPAIEFVNANPEIGLAIRSKERLVDPILSKYATEITEGIVPITKFGKYYSKVSNVKYLVEQYVNSSDNENTAEFMAAEGHPSAYSIAEYASGFIPKSAVAGVGPLSHEQANLPLRRVYFSPDFAEKLAREAEFYNIKVLNALKNTLRHELNVHLFGITDEKELEELLIKFYEGEISKYVGDNTPYGYWRHSKEKHTREDYQEELRISRHRAGIIEKLYSRINPKELSIDQLISILEKEGLSEKDIETAISLYQGKAVKSGKNSKGEKSDTEYKASEEYSQETAYKEGADGTTEGTNSESVSESSGESEGTSE